MFNAAPVTESKSKSISLGFFIPLLQTIIAFVSSNRYNGIMYPDEFESYFSLLWLLVLFVCVLLAFLFYLYLAIRTARRKESESMESFSLVLEGQEAERQRIAADLHDTVLPNIKDTAVAARVREICGHLMPPDFTRLSLAASLADLCGKFSARCGIECVISIEEKLDLTDVSAENQLHLYRIVQEALTNIEKHSKAQKAYLTARRTSTESILICISDDGIGLHIMPSLQDISGTGLGIRSMQQRAAIIGAKLDFISESTNGLMVRIEIFPEIKP